MNGSQWIERPRLSPESLLGSDWAQMPAGCWEQSPRGPGALRKYSDTPGTESLTLSLPAMGKF